MFAGVALGSSKFFPGYGSWRKPSLRQIAKLRAIEAELASKPVRVSPPDGLM
jgi:hypothetical protein